MKHKTSLIATAATMALFSSANGQAIIDIVGSTAGRAAAIAAIQAQLDLETYRFYKKDGTSTSLTSADAVIFKGNLGVGGPAVIVRTYWAGSASGVDLVSNQVQLDKLLISTAVVTTGNNQLAGTQAALALSGDLAPASTNTTPEFGFSDVKQTATEYQSNTLVDSTSVFVIPFRYFASESIKLTYPAVDNISSLQARLHFTLGGETPLSIFTGSAGDEAITVYGAGRDNDSGTRITCFADNGSGVFTQASQYLGVLAGSGNSATVSLGAYAGNGGYSSGGDLSKVLGATGELFIGYLGGKDASDSIGLGAKELKYNGVAYSTDNIKNGSYTYWSYYQQMRMDLTGKPEALSLYNSIKSALIALPTDVSVEQKNIKLSEMKVKRDGDGTTVKPGTI